LSSEKEREKMSKIALVLLTAAFLNKEKGIEEDEEIINQTAKTMGEDINLIKKVVKAAHIAHSKYHTPEDTMENIDDLMKFVKEVLETMSQGVDFEF
jgi:hypothetical protein